MRGASSVTLCLFLLFALVCPAICMAQSGNEYNSHSCCPENHGSNPDSGTPHSGQKPCGHTASATQPSSSAILLTAAPSVVSTGPVLAVPAAVTLPPAPRPLKPPSPRQLAILRI